MKRINWSKKLQKYQNLTFLNKSISLSFYWKIDYTIDLKNGKIFFYNPIYILLQIKLGKLKRYFDDNFKNKRIHSSKPFVKISILFVSKKNSILRFYVDYCNLLERFHCDYFVLFELSIRFVHWKQIYRIKLEDFFHFENDKAVFSKIIIIAKKNRINKKRLSKL